MCYDDLVLRFSNWIVFVVVLLSSREIMQFEIWIFVVLFLVDCSVFR